jgi:flagellar basal-body rod protein FlgF
MERGIYSATSGGLQESRRLEIIANNLANVNTVGFKASRLVSRQQEFNDTLTSTIQNTPGRSPFDQNHVPGVVNVELSIDFSAGPVEFTGNPLNVALVDTNQFFMVLTPEGEKLTRAGNFTINSDGMLSTPDGMPISGEGGEIPVLSANAKISKSGSVLVDGEVVGRVKVVQIEDLTQLQKEAGVRFTLPQGADPENVTPNLIPASVELPNVSVVEAMVEMIVTQRAFEGYTKTVQTINELNETNLRVNR